MGADKGIISPVGGHMGLFACRQPEDFPDLCAVASVNLTTIPNTIQNCKDFSKKCTILSKL